MIATLLITAFTAQAPAILIRHDRPDARYLAVPARFPFLAEVGFAHGTLIAPDWILTAAHVADTVSVIDDHVRVAGRAYAVRRIVFHPTWIGDLPQGYAEPDWIDLALIQLEEPVGDAAPARLYDTQDELNRPVTLVGRGKTGNGRTGPVIEDRKLRAATNVVSRVEGPHVFFTYDAPPGGTELEGVGGPGDSGGPALAEVDGAMHVLAVCHRNDGQGNPDLEFKYGTSDTYVRVSTHLDWIRGVLATGRAPAAWNDLERTAWPDNDAGAAAKAFFEAFNSRDRARLTEYEQRWRTENELRGLSAEARAETWLRQSNKWNGLSPQRWLQLTPGKLVVLARSGDQWRSVRFEMQAPAPRRVREISIARQGPPK